MNKTSLKLCLIIIIALSVGCGRKLPPEEKAIRLVEKSQALGTNLSVGQTIDNWLREKGDEVKPIGWQATRKGGEVYLVSYRYKVYSFREGTGERGFFFEANLATERVRDVTKDVARTLRPLSSPFQSEKQIPEELMRKLEEKEKMLPGE